MIPAINCLIPATNHPGIVSTATRMPKNVVPQTIATNTTAIRSLISFKVVNVYAAKLEQKKATRCRVAF